jgi:UDP-N-acetylmuramoylalanine--D-glutamate ligase
MSVAAKKKPAARKRSAKASKAELVLGLGATGLSVARYLRRQGRNAIFADTRSAPPGLEALAGISPDADVHAGNIPDRILKNVSRIIVSPGVADTEPLLTKARDGGIEIVSDIEVFAAEAKAPIVAVTGSNGKSTVTTLLFLMCDASGVPALAGGNLGTPALDLLQEAVPNFYILELSSFQLQRTRALAAKVAVLLNVSPDHLDWHASEDEYRAAKYSIFNNAGSAVINRRERDELPGLPKKLPCYSFGLDEPGEGGFGLVVEDGVEFLARGEQLLLATSDVAMVGAHNIENALAALAAGELMGLEMSAMLQVLDEFPGLPHRMQLVGRVNYVAYINDSKATNVGAAIAAVRSLPGPVVLIAGGQGKGGDFDAFARAVCSKLRCAILLGEDAPRIAAAFQKLASIECVGSMQVAVSRAAAIAEPGDTVLLAPACASFDQYANYGARGDDFRRHVKALLR